MTPFRKTNKERSLASERQLARLVGGTVQRASGAVNRRTLKGDVVSKPFLFEDKVTKHRSYAVTRELFRTHSKHSWKVKKRPALRINFEDDGTGPLRLYVISEREFMEYLQLIENGNV